MSIFADTMQTLGAIWSLVCLFAVAAFFTGLVRDKRTETREARRAAMRRHPSSCCPWCDGLEPEDVFRPSDPVDSREEIQTLEYLYSLPERTNE